MKNATITEIKYVKNSLEILAELAIEMELDRFLVEEHNLELSSDINSSY